MLLPSCYTSYIPVRLNLRFPNNTSLISRMLPKAIIQHAAVAVISGIRLGDSRKARQRAPDLTELNFVNRKANNAAISPTLAITYLPNVRADTHIRIKWSDNSVGNPRLVNLTNSIRLQAIMSFALLNQATPQRCG